MSAQGGADLEATSQVTDHLDGSTRCKREDLNLHGLPHWILSLPKGGIKGVSQV